MNKEDYIKIINEKINDESRYLLLKQVDRFYNAVDNYKIVNNNYKIGDLVKLKKGTLLHGTYKNIEGLEKIAKKGLICDLIVEGRNSKYPLTVGVWNLKKDYLLSFLTRKEEFMKHYLVQEISSLVESVDLYDVDKLNYFYEEVFGNDNISYQERCIRLLEDIEEHFDSRYHRLYDIVRLSYKTKAS